MNEEYAFDPDREWKKQKKKFLYIGLFVISFLWFWNWESPKPNTNPLRPVENAEPYVWPKGCTPEAYETSLSDETAGTQILCACADPKYEIRDWYERGLPSRGVSKRKKRKYYRIANDAVPIEILSKNTCFNDKVVGTGNDFFSVKNEGNI